MLVLPRQVHHIKVEPLGRISGRASSVRTIPGTSKKNTHSPDRRRARKPVSGNCVASNEIMCFGSGPPSPTCMHRMVHVQRANLRHLPTSEESLAKRHKNRGIMIVTFFHLSKACVGILGSVLRCFILISDPRYVLCVSTLGT